MPQATQPTILLAFDDSAPTHLDIVIPELVKREIVGTFYIVPAGEGFQSRRSEWERVVESPYVKLGNHTYTHRGVTNAVELDAELAQADALLKQLDRGLAERQWRAFARPGGVPWQVSEEEVQAALTKFQLVRRPPTANPIVKDITPEQSRADLLAIVDDVLANGGVRQFVFHGVGGDWHSTPAEDFVALLDRVEAHRHELWITDPVGLHLNSPK